MARAWHRSARSWAAWASSSTPRRAGALGLTVFTAGRIAGASARGALRTAAGAVGMTTNGVAGVAMGSGAAGTTVGAGLPGVRLPARWASRAPTGPARSRGLATTNSVATVRRTAVSLVRRGPSGGNLVEFRISPERELPPLLSLPSGLGHALLEPGPQHTLEDLARRVERHGVDDLEPLRDLDAGQPVRLQEGGELLQGWRIGAGSQRDEGAHPLPEPFVGVADAGRLGNPRVAEEAGLGLGRADVVAAPDDDVLLAAGDVEVALTVEEAEV